MLEEAASVEKVPKRGQRNVRVGRGTQLGSQTETSKRLVLQLVSPERDV